MAKKESSKFNIADGLQYTQDTQETPKTEETKKTQEDLAQYAMTPQQVAEVIAQSQEILKNFTPKQGRPKKTEEEKLRGYRYNLNLDKDLKEYLDYIAWKNRTSITQFINDLIRGSMEEYIAQGGSAEEWESRKK